MADTYRVKGVAHGVGVVRQKFDFTFMTSETENELIWIQARREAKKRAGADASIEIDLLSVA